MVARRAGREIRVRVLKGVYPLAASLGVMAAVTAILWRLTLVIDGADRLVYLYLFPVALITALFNGRLALLCAAVAIVCADYFLQAPLYDLANEDPLEYGDLALLCPFGGHNDQISTARDKGLE
jgi:K+-sensing histidine kinase KdpD